MTDALDIINNFMTYTVETGPCPIHVNSGYWLKKLCALAERCADAENQIALLKAEKTVLSKGRNVIVIEILGETILQSELDNLAETWVHFGMPRGKYVLRPAEIEQLTNGVRAVISRFDKEGKQ